VKLLLGTTAGLFGVLAGLAAIASGEADDSPGLQGLGLILILFVGLRFICAMKRR
jgi:hypothetical protein